jgi:poly(3-hydroxybutyrate) depolymerase
VLALVALWAGPVWAALDPGDHRITLQHGGRQRSYIVHAPLAAREGRPLPVILNFHGGGGNAENQQKYSRMDALADAEGFLAVEASGRIAAIAPVAGAKVLKAGGPARPVPVMYFHSVDDPRALYAGGLGPPFPMTTSQVFHSAVEPTIREWAATIGCPTDARVTAELTGQAGSREAGHTATRYVWAPCREGAEIALWKFTGTGHVWPGGLQDYLPRLLGPSTALVDANLEMWRFFQRFSL